MKYAGKILVGAVAVLLIAYGFFLIRIEKKEIREGFERQEEEESLVDAYIHLLQEQEAVGATGEIQDDIWYERDGIIYTPDYASGYIQCVLEVPSAGIKRPVFSGTWEEIAADLDIWMVVAARPDYILGETHYVIYGHNHTEQNLSFNNLQPAVQLGDEFTLTDPGGIRVYAVTNLYSISRLEAAALADNFALSSDKCYIVTCGRNEHRYRDYVVEGTFIRSDPLLNQDMEGTE